MQPETISFLRILCLPAACMMFVIAYGFLLLRDHMLTAAIFFFLFILLGLYLLGRFLNYPLTQVFVSFLTFC